MEKTYIPRRLISYVVASDTGLAPNVSGGRHCTLTVCKPIVRAAATVGQDFIIGVSTRPHGENRVIYVMQVDEKIPYAEYFRDTRFQCKKPLADSQGDNFFQQQRGELRIVFRNAAHFGSAEKIGRDLRAPFAVVGSRFWYFGDNAPRLPGDLSKTNLTVPGQSRRGHRINENPQTIEAFMTWLGQFRPGVHGMPRDIAVALRHS